LAQGPSDDRRGYAKVDAEYSADEIAALGPEQIRAKIESMSPTDFGVGHVAIPGEHEPAPRGLLSEVFQPKETDLDV